MEGLARNAMETCLAVLSSPDNYSARANLMWTATLALNGLTAAGLGKIGCPLHLIEHSLSGLFNNIPHGAGLAALMPGWLRFFGQRNPVRLAQFGRRVFDLQQHTEKDTATSVITNITQWLEDIGAPTRLADLSISESRSRILRRTPRRWPGFGEYRSIQKNRSGRFLNSAGRRDDTGRQISETIKAAQFSKRRNVLPL